MNLNIKISVLFAAIAAMLIALLMVISLFAFRSFSIASSSEHIRTAAEIVRVHLTESMINGVIDKRESFLKRLMEVQGLASARVVRSPAVVKQFGSGLHEEAPSDDLENQVLREGKAVYDIIETENDTLIRGTIPFIATNRGEPNCLQCHDVQEGMVLGAVTMKVSIGNLKTQAMLTVAALISIVALFMGIAFVLIRRMINPVSATAIDVENAVQRALRGDFKAKVDQITKDEIGQIATDMNRLLAFLDQGLTRIGANVARLTSRTPSPDENQLSATIDMVEGLTRAAHFKQAIEEDETKAEIHTRLVRALEGEFGIREFSIYEMQANKNHMTPLYVDGQPQASCRWCDPQILVRSEGCRARRTGHLVDGVLNPGICYSFMPPEEAMDRKHICLPIIQSGAVGNVLQLVVKPDEEAAMQEQLPYVSVYLREAAPVLETKKLMETLRESALRDPMTGLNNRRFLEEYVDTLVANVQRRQSQVGIMMLDLDFFKMVNDTYGHDAGDAVIKAMAKVLRQAVRASDMVIRYGGEEFLIVLLDASPEQADQIAEKIRSTVEALDIQAGTTVLRKTISIGVADFPSDSDTFWQAVKFADVALYQAKDTGRNKVVRFNTDMWKDKSY
ncbi:putative GGDEF: diguanylate cyclase (GGDEF) domain [Magnetospirillum gryphiswaldense MSR-1 v2]|uniref:diguanylate cyclase n=1 Tax=Magnetospirillum gryphiswaldense (strain DSM 6361 / JCM 21280 / NBRC 15271 / MSR-1) TaxID=431944 RepID=V6EYT4_MAGGM|nr:diguanylate cyclase [Magnetospirillum gryphiswaldense]CDK97383.1 putative GGDEF: diguanylate cyclase (GGDEF) domain [Magnetospirillum gryphiswaldense MSR-1 v2]